MKCATASLIVATAFASTATGATINWGTSAPTYSNVVDFDGTADAGLTITLANQVSGDPGIAPWGTDNALSGNGIVFFNFDSDIESFSVQYLDDSGPAGPFGGGFLVALFDDGSQVGGAQFASAGDGTGDQWLNITADGTPFDEVRLAPGGFGQNVKIDNVSWNVPEPGSLALLGLGGLALLRRRRS